MPLPYKPNTRYSLIRKAVENPAAFQIHDGNHVRRILADQVEELLSFDQLPANAMDLQVLIDGVEIEQENEGGQTTHSLRKNMQGMEVRCG